MSEAKSKEEARIPADKEAPARGRVDKHEPSVRSELAEGERKPRESGENRMGGVHKGGTEHEMVTHIGHAGMGHARALLERETERKEHVAHVAGEAIHEHSGRHSHK